MRPCVKSKRDGIVSSAQVDDPQDGHAGAATCITGAVLVRAARAADVVGPGRCLIGVNTDEENRHPLLVATARPRRSLAGPDVGVSIGINQPGVYGRVDIGNVFAATASSMPSRWSIAPPRVVVQRQPIYLYVPPGHQRNWRAYCGRYSACNQPVYFVQERWVRERWEHERRDHRAATVRAMDTTIMGTAKAMARAMARSSQARRLSRRRGSGASIPRPLLAAGQGQSSIRCVTP